MVVNMRRIVLIALIAAGSLLSLGSNELPPWRAVPEEVPVDVPFQVEADFSFSWDKIFGYVITYPLKITIRNKSNESITILWDECSLVTPYGVSERIIHKGVRFEDKAAPQAPTLIAPQSWLDEVVWPAKRIEWIVDEWIKWPIPVDDGSRIRLHLTWRTQEGRQRSASWSWRISGPKTVTVFLYVYSPQGQVISDAKVECKEAAGNTFRDTTGANGFVIIKGAAGTWQFTVSGSGYKANSWSQEITQTGEQKVYLERDWSLLWISLLLLLVALLLLVKP
ncbi:MAG: carboxypeptidase-like regulatory domain-containing protein [Candidatus Bipolaricaulaceae bacterium]